MNEPTQHDPVLARRRTADRLARLGQRLGYGQFGLAIGLFFFGLVGDFTSVIARAIIVAMVAGSLVLAPAIVVSYAVKAAETDDRERNRQDPPSPHLRS